MGAFSRWYISMLKRRPFMTNMGSAAVMMTTGDVAAQELERYHLGDRLTGHKDESETPDDHKLSLKRYFTVNPVLAQAAAERAYDETKNQHKRHAVASTESSSKKQEQSKNNKQNSGNNGAIEHNDTSILFDKVEEKITYAIDTAKAEYEFWDGYRTATMIGWSVGAFTPIYVTIYKIFDRFMPKQTPTTVCARVVLSLVISIPMNTAFFAYGTFVHHTAEWVAIQREWAHELEEMGISTEMVQDHGSVVPYDWEMMCATACLKLESELFQTIMDSAKVWVPLNFVNFTVAPPHLRPLLLLTFSVFWNAYLSLAQHRDLLISIPNESTEQE